MPSNSPGISKAATSSSQGAGESQGGSPLIPNESPELVVPISIKKEPPSLADSLNPGTSNIASTTVVDPGTASGDVKTSDVNLGEDPTTSEELRRRRVVKLQTPIFLSKDFSDKLPRTENTAAESSSRCAEIHDIFLIAFECITVG